MFLSLSLMGVPLMGQLYCRPLSQVRATHVKIRAHVMNDFSIIIEIRWKIGLSATPLLGIISLQNFAHVTTGKLSCHVQNFIVIIYIKLGWAQNEISIEFELRWKSCLWNGPLADNMSIHHTHSVSTLVWFGFLQIKLERLPLRHLGSYRQVSKPHLSWQ